MKKFSVLLMMCCISFSCFAAINNTSRITALTPNVYCGHAVPTSDPGFCASFKSIGYCHCREHGMPPTACSDMNRIYKMMLDTYGSLERACNFQHDVPPKECVDDWNFYNGHCH